MNARPSINLNVNVTDVMNRFFEALGYERKKPPQLTRIVIVRVPEEPMLAFARVQQRPTVMRRSRY